MITPITIRNTTFGEGIPKICIPIVAETTEKIISDAKALAGYNYDVVEWRMDFFEDVMTPDKVVDVLKSLREVIGDKLLLATFRTANEGGEKEIDNDYYKELNILAAQSGYADMIDIELFTGDDIVKDMVEEIHNAGSFVVMSNHDFNKTPPKEEIIERLKTMQALGADLAKIAVMPNSSEDVLTLLSATNDMNTIHADKPVITMAMGKLGLISRLSGSTFGSAMTFGAAGKASAPGQIDAKQLEQILKIV